VKSVGQTGVASVYNLFVGYGPRVESVPIQTVKDDLSPSKTNTKE
jgi:hypothetical protein